MALFLVPHAAAQKPRVYKDTVSPNWSEDGNRFWYRNRLVNSKTEFIVVDAVNGIRKPAFDHQKMAKLLGRKLKKPVRSSELPITNLAWNSDGTLLVTADRHEWIYNEQTNQLTETEASAHSAGGFPMTVRKQVSGPSDREIYVTITNQSEFTLTMFWIDSSGGSRKFQTIAPNSSVRQHTYVGHAWLIKAKSDSDGKTLNVGYFRVQPGESEIEIQQEDLDRMKKEKAAEGKTPKPKRTPANKRSRQAHSGQTSPDGRFNVFVKNHNLWVKLRNDDKEKAVTQDGSSDNTYRKDASRARLVHMNYSKKDYSDSTPDVRWSNDSRWLVALQTTVVAERKVTYVNSSPKDRLQPKVESYPYAKPGDEIPTVTVHLFDTKTFEETKVEHPLLADPWQIQFLKFDDQSDHEDGPRFWLKYNQRGHQVVRIVEVNAATGKALTVVENRADTFVHYSDSGKSVINWLPNGDMIWASERSGWNHLYRIDVDGRRVRNQITSGDWNVKRIESIDQNNQVIWFFAVGSADGQDPYHEHFCRVNFDGTDFHQLTQDNGTHSVTMSPDRRFFIDRFSRVDLAGVTELRRSSDGAKLCDLESGDASEIQAVRRLPERFVAKGRDDQTDIYGIIHFPRNFDPSKQYPIVENIYAGPHDHHVPKAFRASYRHQHQIADRGMIVVQIDGMGTAWRSKKFHDVCFQNLKDAGFPDRVKWIKAAAQQRPWMDLGRVGIYGGSAGGQNALAALIWHGDFYKAAVADCGCHDNRMDKIWWNEQWMGVPKGTVYEDNSNTTNIAKMQGKLMLVVGEMDRNVDPASTTQVVKALIDADRDFVFLPIIGAGHGACEGPYGSKRRADFLAKTLQTN